jgi:FtsH-binding integral membrane protein
VHLAALQLVIAVLGALLFTGFITLDMQRVARARAASDGDTILMAVSVYLDIVNLFLFLLQIFGMGGRRR